MEMGSKQTDNAKKARLITMFNNLHYLRLKYISNRNFLIIASIIVGIVSALAAVVLKKGVHYLQYLTGVIADYESIKFVYIVLPLCGIVATFLIIKYVFKKPFDKGLGSIIYDISWNSGNIKAHKTFSHILTSGITVGFGGSAGLEAPIAVTGSAIGSNIAKLFRLGYNERVVLLACGAAAGITAVFNSPIAGVIFAIEVLLTNFSIPIFIPLLISAATSAMVSNLIYKGQLFYLITDKWHYNAIPFYIVLGAITGLFSVYITRVTLFVEGKLNKKNTLLKPIIGGLVLGGLIFIFPPLWGEGYKTIELLLSSADKGTLLDNSLFAGFSGNSNVILIFVAAIIFIKSFATSLTIGSGGNGGIFAPSLFTGALIGFLLAFFINGTGIMHLSTVNFIAVGMAGILSGVVRAPLTAIFLIAEVTGGYVLFIPLMIVSALSYFIARYFEPYSIYTKRLAQKGLLMTDDEDMNTLSLLKMQDVIEKDFVILKPTDTLARLVSVFQESNRNLFPVVDRNNVFYGMVHLEKAKSYLFKTELHENMKITDIMDTEVVTVSLDDKMVVVMEQFEKAKSWNIVVIDGNKYIGIVSKSNLINHYRRILKRSTNLF
jgi:CIC family chloride channel protein